MNIIVVPSKQFHSSPPPPDGWAKLSTGALAHAAHRDILERYAPKIIRILGPLPWGRLAEQRIRDYAQKTGCKLLWR